MHAAASSAQTYIKPKTIPDDSWEYQLGDPLIPFSFTDEATMTAVESDWLSLFRKVSQISKKSHKDDKGPIRGIYAKIDIPPNTVICEFRGIIVAEKDSFHILETRVYSSFATEPFLSPNRMFQGVGPGILSLRIM